MYNKIAMSNLLKLKIDFSTLIYEIRDKQVMLDFDLAALYGYELKRLNEQVKRNIERFPKDFMFQITREELNFVKSQIATSRKLSMFAGQKGGVRHLPYAFTEQGVYMLSTVLKGDVAVNQSIAIMRAFRDMRHLIKNNESIFQRINTIENNQLKFQNETDEKFKMIYQKFINNEIPSQKIFFNGQIYDSISFIIKIIRSAKNKLIIIDNYVDTQTLDLLTKKDKQVEIKLYTTKKGNLLKQSEIDKFNKQYPKIEILQENSFHDRFIIVDNKLTYHIGASLKDAGNKSFVISKINDSNITNTLLNVLKNN